MCVPTKHVFQFADVAGLDATVRADFADLGGNPGPPGDSAPWSAGMTIQG